MAKSSLNRLFSSLSDHSIAKLSESATRSTSIPLSRFLCSSVQQPESNNEESANKGDREAVKANLESENKEEGEEDEDEVDLNKETGEVGGPRGPEPTRYGDWERNGRCYDF